jgi:hypothetical protein
MRTLFCLLTFATLLLRGQEEGDAGGKPAVIPAAEKTKLQALLPAAARPHFYRSDLYEYIDGGAEIYHQYGLAALAHQEYRAGDTDVTVDIYDMSEPLRAFGIYAAERSPGYHFIAIGAEGYSNEGMLNFLQGAYYVKLLGFSDSGKSAAVLEDAARSISRKIGGGRTVPQVIDWLPAGGLVDRSQKYVIKEPIGHECLSPAATAVYRVGDQETTLLVSLAPQPQGVVAQLKKSFESSGTVAKFSGLPVEAWRGANRYEGEMIFFARGRYTIVLIHPPPEPEKFLREILGTMK